MRTKLHDCFKQRRALGIEVARRAVVHLGRQLTHHAEVVAGLEGRHRNEHLAADLVQRVFQFSDAVSRVDVDQHDADFGGGNLQEQPLGAVVCPNAHAITLADATAKQRAGKATGFAVQLTVTHAHVLVTRHQRFAIRKTLHDGLKMLANGGLDQRHMGVTGVVAESQIIKSAHVFSPRGCSGLDSIQ